MSEIVKYATGKINTKEGEEITNMVRGEGGNKGERENVRKKNRKSSEKHETNRQ